MDCRCYRMAHFECSPPTNPSREVLEVSPLWYLNIAWVLRPCHSGGKWCGFARAYKKWKQKLQQAWAPSIPSPASKPVERRSSCFARRDGIARFAHWAHRETALRKPTPTGHSNFKRRVILNAIPEERRTTKMGLSIAMSVVSVSSSITPNA